MIQACLELIVCRLLEEAKDRKRRVNMRLREMRGDWIRDPVRGPMLPNGRSSLQWLLYQNAVRKHKRATGEVVALLRVLPKARTEPLPPPASVADKRNT